MRTSLLVIFLMIALVPWCHADRVVKTDGTSLSGTIVSEDGKTVVIEVKRGAASMRFPIERSAIASITRGPATRPTAATQPASTQPAATQPVGEEKRGPGYYPLPVIGEIGVDVTAATLREALGHARRARPEVVVIVFDTDGGAAEHVEGMVEAIEEQKDLRVVAYVRKAVGAGAVVALVCREIFMAPGAVIGAGADGEAEALRSVATQARAAAERGGHSAALAGGMFEIGKVLAVRQVDGRPEVVEGAAPGAKVLKDRGRVLTLTAVGAVECGLAAGTAGSLETLNEAMGISEWHKVMGPGWYLMERKGREAREEMARKEFLADRQRAREEYLERVGPEMEEIETRLAQIKVDLRAAEDTLRDLDRQWQYENRMIDNEHREALRIDPRLNPQEKARLKNKADARRDEKTAAARERFQPKAIDLREKVNALTREQQGLSRKLKGLVDGTPKVVK